jgi:hypothetical protein
MSTKAEQSPLAPSKGSGKGRPPSSRERASTASKTDEVMCLAIFTDRALLQGHASGAIKVTSFTGEVLKESSVAGSLRCACAVGDSV